MAQETMENRMNGLRRRGALEESVLVVMVRVKRPWPWFVFRLTSVRSSSGRRKISATGRPCRIPCAGRSSRARGLREGHAVNS